MKSFFFLVSLAIVSFVVMSCQRSQEIEPIPADDATPEERITLEKSMSHITEVFKENGYKGAFDKMPIIVTSGDPDTSGWVGLCAGIGEGTGRYIAIKHWAFEQDLKDDTKSEVTSILLHEIGHCYFGRGHDSELIASAEYIINITYFNERGGTQELVDGVPATIMYTTQGERPYRSILTSNRDLQTYYVRELLSIEHMRSVNDLRKFKSIKMIKKSPGSAQNGLAE
jgi:hypothetical protein